MRGDCDGDTLLLRVDARRGQRAIPAASKCFAPRAVARARYARGRASRRLVQHVELLEQGVGACARKVGEEAVEVAVAALDESDKSVVEEAASLVYHLYVLLYAARRPE